MQFFSAHFRFVRHDERGCGMSDWNDRQLTVEQWTDDLEAIIAAARPADPVTLLGISQGGVACITYAIRHPERVARLILYGGYARGALRRGTPDKERAYTAMVALARAYWATTTRRSGRCSRRDSFRAAAQSSSSGSTTCA
jgi:pimeloyl-ACP methyl ester carboxylesterase